MMFFWIIFLLIVQVCTGCSHQPLPTREPAVVNDMAAFNQTEDAICLTSQCKHFIAPCHLPTLELGPTISLKEEQYLLERERLLGQKYCPLPKRQLSVENYNGGTCLFIFYKNESDPNCMPDQGS